MNATSRWLVLATGLALFGCSGSGNAERPVSCDPLEIENAAEESLGRVVAAGRASDGTVYLVDEPRDGSNEFRVFVSDGGMLQRRRVLGSGHGSDEGLNWYSFSVDDGKSGFSLFIEVEGTTAVTMAVVVGPTDARGPGIPAEAETLESIDADALEVSIEDLPSEVEVEYFAETETGERLLVIRPRDDWDYEDFRLFYGGVEEMIEREVTSVERQRDGGSTRIFFELPAGPAEAYFPVEFDGDMVVAGPANLTRAEDTVPLARLEPSSDALDSMTFWCAP